jgi:S-adenosylmethionine hydrolase
VRVIGVNAGHAFSFVREAAEELRWASVPAEGSQFRSRDLFPQAAGAIALGQADALGTEIDRADIPLVPENRIAYIDGYGNLKTTIRSDDDVARSASKVRVRIGQTERVAVASDGSFEVEQGVLAFAPGSSGWKDDAAEAEISWMELFLRGGNAWEAFDRPQVGDPVEISA